MSSNIIIIDTVPLCIYLYGINNTISNLGSSYVDAGAISYDLSYGIKDVTGTDTVTTSQVGTYHITYDARLCMVQSCKYITHSRPSYNQRCTWWSSDK